MTGPQDVRSDSVAKYDPTDWWRLIAEARYVASQQADVNEYRRLLLALADQLEGARAEIERLRSREALRHASVLAATSCHIQQARETEAWQELADRAVTIADEAFGLGPVETFDETLSRIEHGIGNWHRSMAEQERVIDRMRPLVEHLERERDMRPRCMCPRCAIVDAYRAARDKAGGS